MYGIYVRYYFYKGTLMAPEDGPLYEYYESRTCNSRINFETLEEAEAWMKAPYHEKGRNINELEEYIDKKGVKRWAQVGTYYLSHGEYSRPDYRIVKLKNA